MWIVYYNNECQIYKSEKKKIKIVFIKAEIIEECEPDSRISERYLSGIWETDIVGQYNKRIKLLYY